MNSGLFYLIISFLDIVLYNPKTSSLQKSNDKIKRFKFCLFFFLITISYEKFVYSTNIILFNFQIEINRIIIFINSLCILFCLYRLYNEYKGKIKEIGLYILNENKKSKVVTLMIMGSPQSLIFYFSFYYILKLIFLFIQNPVIIFYANIILLVFGDTCKYLIFLLCELIIYGLNKIKIEKEKIVKNANKNDTEENKIIKI